MKTTRAKFQCESVTNRDNYGKRYQTVILNAVCSDGDKQSEDNQFAEATPSGRIEMSISNQDAIDLIKPGRKYYIDFTPEKDEE